MRKNCSSTARHNGFTLIELMVTVGIIAILGALAAPYLNNYVIRNTLTTIGGEFSGSILKARTEAVNKNICTTMCISNTVDNSLPVCMTTGEDWQVGWIVFLNPDCNSALNSPASAEDLLQIRRPASQDYTLPAQTSGRRKLMFNPRGSPGLAGASEFDLVYTPNPTLTNQYSFNICMDGMGRTRNIAATSSCASY